MGKALYRTYRSKNLDEVVGQEHITTALANSLRQGTICHAYLFTGPRGVGKTSIARILAHEVNGLPYDETENHLDIIEIDAASNRRIDEIRDLRDKIHIAPTSAKFKVYIIDEVHMLTKEAFNALLKTLEEPPAHVIFILATTETHKLPETIISRTQRYAFRPIDQQKVIDHLRFISEKEGVEISNEALQLIAEHGGGSFRDSISLLDQIRNIGRKVEAQDVHENLGIPPADLIATILHALQNHDTVIVAQTLQTIRSQGYEPSQAAKYLSQAIRAQILNGAPNSTELLSLLDQLIQVPTKYDPAMSLEISLLDFALKGAPVRIVEQPVVPAQHVKPQTQPLETPKPQVEPAETSVQATEPAEEHATSDHLLDETTWQKVLLTIKKQNNLLFTMLNKANHGFEPGKITIELATAFNKKRLDEAKNKQVLNDCLESTAGAQISVATVVSDKPAKPKSSLMPLPDDEDEIVHSVAAKPEQKSSDLNNSHSHTKETHDEAKSHTNQKSDDAFSAITDIFGGGEVLES